MNTQLSIDAPAFGEAVKDDELKTVGMELFHNFNQEELNFRRSPWLARPISPSETRRTGSNLVEAGIRYQVTPLTVISAGVGTGIGEDSPNFRLAWPSSTPSIPGTSGGSGK